MKAYLDKHIFPFVQKPGRYIGNEWNSIVKNQDSIKIKTVLCFPDLYEIGMSYLGIKILYNILNGRPDIACERAFAPGQDMEELLIKHNLPLFSLESARPLSEFEIIGFSLTYELGYTNMLNMLHLAGLPLRSSERDNNHPLVIAGGPCVSNPEPVAEFVDVFCVGEAEEMILEVVGLCQEFLIKIPTSAGFTWKDRKELLRRLSSIEGVYVPSLYKAENTDSTSHSQSLKPKEENMPFPVTRRFVRSLEDTPYPVSQPVPFISVIQDRISLEIMRGCPGGCRFCQATAFYRPVRSRTVKKIIELAKECYKKTGYEEISLVSLASGCYPHIEELLPELERIFKPLGVTVSLPSLRIESLEKVLPLLERQKKPSLTVAPEAGTDRMLKLINKKVTCEQIMRAVEKAYKLGWKRIKIYFMIGLPGETEEDIIGIANMIQAISNLKRNIDGHPAELTVTISSFIPKPHTGYEREPMESTDALRQKQDFLRREINTRRIKINFSDTGMNYVEALLCRGDRHVAEVIYHVWRRGARHEAWKGHFNFGFWQETCAELNLDPSLFVNRGFAQDEPLPWQHIKIS